MCIELHCVYHKEIIRLKTENKGQVNEREVEVES